MSQSDTQPVHTCLKTTGDGPNYAVLYGDELARAGDAYGFEDGGMVECQILNDENTRINVSYSDGRLQGISVHPADDPDSAVEYGPAEIQPENGTRWVPESGDQPPVKVAPTTCPPATPFDDRLFQTDD